jgi:hypothetical protein
MSAELRLAGDIVLEGQARLSPGTANGRGEHDRPLRLYVDDVADRGGSRLVKPWITWRGGGVRHRLVLDRASGS